MPSMSPQLSGRETGLPTSGETDDGFVYRPIDEIWHEVVSARPDALAACGPEGMSLTYAQLDRVSDVAAARLRAALDEVGATRMSPVAALVGHEPAAAVSAIALYKLVWPELTLDPEVPLDRLRGIVAGRRGGGGPRGARVLGPRRPARRPRGSPARRRRGAAGSVPEQRWPSVPADGISGIVYTSGSTGAPKGVAANYRTVGHHLHHRHGADWIRPDDRYGLVMPLSFGAARGDLSAALLTGASVHFFDPRARGAGPLPAWLAEHRVTLLSAPPSLLSAVVRTLGEGEQLSPTLRMVRSAGEKVLCSEALAIRRALPDGCRLLNAFGSSEATMVSAYEITAETPDLPRPVPAGWPVPGFAVRVERPDGSPADPGETGELVVVSPYLPVGYWRDPERTRLRYTDLGNGRRSVATGDLAVLLPGGAFRLAGRKDLGVKIRGNLVEPSEVEAALLHCEGVQDAVVVGRTTPSGRERLVAYVVLARHAQIVRTAELRRELRQSLPSYMIPEAVVFLAELPRNERHKLDRSALPEPPERAAADLVAPRTDGERRIAELWATVLGLDEVGAEDDFFDLGGDSLSAEEMVARLGERHGIHVSSRLLLDASTVAEFARAVEAAGPDAVAARAGRLVAIRRTGSRPPLFCVTGTGRLGMTFLPLARRLDDEQPVWALQEAGREQARFKDWSVRRMARRHVAALRTAAPHGPYLLAGHSFGGAVAFEMAHQLRDAGEQVALLAVMDSFAPHPSALPPVRRRSAAEWVTTARRYAGVLSGRALRMGPVPEEQGGGFRKPVSGAYTRQAHLVSLFYRGRPYPGRTLVMTAADEPEAARRDLRSTRWAGYLSGRWHHVEVPGVHRTMLNEPHVAELAAVLDREITAALG